MSVFFYISGHGFGHAIRQIEIINALAELVPVPVVVRTTAPRWLFERNARAIGLDRCLTILESEVDPGVVQHDSLRLDEPETIRRAVAFYDGLEHRACEEADVLRRHGAALVVSDAPPLALAGAALAGIPSVVCANFTWDWIYESYAASVTSGAQLLSRIRASYALAGEGWRLPMHGGFAAVAPIVDVPLVARKSRTQLTRDEIRHVLALPLGTPLALVSFGGYGVKGLPLDRLDCARGWRIVVTVADGDGGAPKGGFHAPPVIAIEESTLYSNGLKYQDLVYAVDVVVSKPGYGIISDCIASGAALLYTSRGRFAEYDVLVRDMPRYLRCGFIEPDDLRAGRWRAALDALQSSPPPPEVPRLDGAQVVAEMIARRVGS